VITTKLLARLARTDSGQVIVLVALMLVVLIGIGGLAIDVSAAYASQRYQRNAADAASLAGAQDLQIGSGRQLPLPADYLNARRDAVLSLTQQLKPSAVPVCATAISNDIVNCAFPGTPFVISVITDTTSPAPTCVQCDPARAVQVQVRRPNFGLAFAKIFGFVDWDVHATSVAGMVFPRKYGLVTLRPVNYLPTGADQFKKDINLAGTNTEVILHGGDVGTNTSAITNADSLIQLDAGYKIYHIDDINPDPWNGSSGDPEGVLLDDATQRIREPIGVVYPTTTGLTAFPNQADGEKSCTGLLPSELPYQAGVDPASIDVTCYGPGVYEREFRISRNTDAAFLDTGIYIFEDGVDISGYLFGGLRSDQPGVALVLTNTSKTFSGANAEGITLNYGDLTCADVSCRATPAVGPGGPVALGGVPLTIMVKTDDTCFQPGSSPRLPILCTSGSGVNYGTNVLKLTGNGILQVAGIVWAPTDNVKVNSNYTGQDGTIGQIIAWTVEYDGGSALNLETAQDDGPGVLRLDTACSPGAVCVSP
jgi:Flp pilus assembly protein TadG